MHFRRWRTPMMPLLLSLVLVLGACGGDDAVADDRDAQTLFDDAFDDVPADLSVVNVPETARRPTVGATYAGGDVDAATQEIHDALVTAGWTVTVHDSDGTRGNIVAERGEDDIQVELTAGDAIVSVNLIFAAPGEGL